MQRFIPFEDDWDLLENLRPEDLIPYRVGLRLPCDPSVPNSGTMPQTQIGLPLTGQLPTGPHWWLS